nr:MAG TPA: hypothetical protein [Caudoviricetes sp.]
MLCHTLGSRSHGSSRSPLRRISHAPMVDNITLRRSMVDAPPKVGARRREDAYK